MRGHDIIVVGTSAGGVPALAEIVRDLPADLPAAVFIVLHLPADSTSHLPEILARFSNLAVAHARHGEPIAKGRIYIAPPDHHMTLRDGIVAVEWGPRINRFRPAIDPLFRSAALSYGDRTVGVVLTGAMSDGAAGLAMVERMGGVAIVQDPQEALFRSMPVSALANLKEPLVLQVREVAAALATLALVPAAGELAVNTPSDPNGRKADPPPNPHPAPGGPDDPAMADPIHQTIRRTDEDMAAQIRGERGGRTAVITCPECGGVLWQVGEDRFVEFRCHTGHIYSADAVFTDQTAAMERSLWSSVRFLKEKSVLTLQLARRAEADAKPEEARRLENHAATCLRHMHLIESILREQVESLRGDVTLDGSIGTLPAPS